MDFNHYHYRFRVECAVRWGAGLENRAGGRLLVRWHQLTSKPRGIVAYSTGKILVCSEDTAGLYWLHWCWSVFIVTFTFCRLIPCWSRHQSHLCSLCNRLHISAVVVIAVTINGTPQSIFGASTYSSSYNYIEHPPYCLLKSSMLRMRG